MDSRIKPLLIMLNGIIPHEVLAEVTQEIDIDTDELFRNPFTVIHELMQCISGLENQVDKEKLMQLMHRNTAEAWAQWAQQEIGASREENAKLEQLPGGVRMVEYIFKIVSTSDNKEAIIEEIRRSVKEPPIAKWVSSFDSLRSEELAQMSFEEHVRKTSNVIANLSETYYKDFLSVLYFVSKECKCKKVPDSLGKLVGYCRDAWLKEDEVLNMLLFDELVVLRNSVKHSNTEISIPDKKVTFIDKNGKKIGPMELTEYKKWYNDYLNKLLNLNIILRIVFRRYWMLHQMANC